MLSTVAFAAWIRAFCDGNRVLACMLVTALLSVLFAWAPVIDVVVTRQFYVPGAGFPLAQSGSLQELRMAGSNLPVAVAVVLAVALALKLLHPRRPSLFPPRFMLYFVSLYLLGPVLVVNGVLKSFWGRPRPVKVEEFGGSFPFIDAWSFGEAFTHRSFVSGEAATIACLLPLALFVPRPWRWQVAAMIGAAVAVVSLNRIAFGGHFLSDVTIAVALVLTIAVMLRQVFYVSHAGLFSNERLEAELTGIGLAWQAKRRADLQAASAAFAGTWARAARGAMQLATMRVGVQTLALSASVFSAPSLPAASIVAGLRGMAAPLSSVIGGTRVRRLSQATPNRS